MSRRSEPAVAKKSSRLDHALWTGLAKLNLTGRRKPVAIPDQIAAVPYKTVYRGMDVEGLIREQVVEINQNTTFFLTNRPKKERIFNLYDVITAMGNKGKVASPKIVRIYYLHLLTLFKHAFYEATSRHATDATFRDFNWNPRFKPHGGEDEAATIALQDAMGDATLSTEEKEQIFAYFMAVNSDVFNYFLKGPNGEVGVEPTLTNTKTPMLTNYILSRIAPEQDVYDAGFSLDLLRSN